MSLYPIDNPDPDTLIDRYIRDNRVHTCGTIYSSQNDGFRTGVSTDINLCVSNEQKSIEKFSVSHTESNNISNDRNPSTQYILSFLDDQTKADLQNLNQIPIVPKSETQEEKSIQETVKDIFNIKDPHDRWKAFVTSQEEITTNLDTKDDFSTVRITNPNDPKTLKEIYHELSDKYGSRISEYLLYEFGNKILYMELKDQDIIKMSTVVSNIHSTFQMRDCNIQPPTINLKNLTTDKSVPNTIFTHVTNKQLGKISDYADLLNATNGEHVYATHIYAINSIYHDHQKSNKNISFRRYVRDNGYIYDLRKAIKKYHQDLMEYLEEIYPYLLEELRKERLNLSDIKSKNMRNRNLPNVVTILFPEEDNIKDMEIIIQEVKKLLPDKDQKTLEETLEYKYCDTAAKAMRHT